MQIDFQLNKIALHTLASSSQGRTTPPGPCACGLPADSVPLQVPAGVCRGPWGLGQAT